MRAAVAPRQQLLRHAELSRAAAIVGAGIALLAVALVAGVTLGSAPVPIDDTFGVLGRRVLGLPVPVEWSPATETIVVDLRLPRVLTAMVVGAALAASGVVFQALLRNPLADPYVIGTAAGASLGAIVGILLPALVPALAVGAGTRWLGIGAAQLLAFLGGLGAVLVVLAVTRRSGRVPVVSLLLTGYAVSSLLAAVIALLMFISGRALGAIFTWLMGSLAGASWEQLALAAPLVWIGIAAVVTRWRRLNVLTLGDEAAAHLGVDVERERLLLTVLATLITSAAVATCGTIGFVGLVVPHVVRLVAGPDHRLLLAASVVFGAGLLALADLGARLAGGIPVGIVTAVLGAPFFIALLRRASGQPAWRA